MAGVTFRQRDNRALFLVSTITAFTGQTLISGSGTISVFDIAGVDQRDFVIVQYRRTGITTIDLILFRRQQGDRFVTPMN